MAPDNRRALRRLQALVGRSRCSGAGSCPAGPNGTGRFPQPNDVAYRWKNRQLPEPYCTEPYSWSGVAHPVTFASRLADRVASDEQARRAYLGLDKSIGKSLQLGFDGFNASSNANIPDQSTAGAATGTLVISGHADHGSSTNKGMNLNVGMTDYSDGKITVEDNKTLTVTYQTSTDRTQQPALSLTFHNYPNGTLDGTLVGKFDVSGDLKGSVSLDLTMSGLTEEDGAGTGKVRRKAGSTTVTGTATSGDGHFQVNLTI